VHIECVVCDVNVLLIKTNLDPLHTLSPGSACSAPARFVRTYWLWIGNS
jgi:hypothetical protein